MYLPKLCRMLILHKLSIFNIDDVEWTVIELYSELNNIPKCSECNNLKQNTNQSSLLLYCTPRHRRNLKENLNLGAIFDYCLCNSQHVWLIFKKLYLALTIMSKEIINFKLLFWILCEREDFLIINYCNIRQKFQNSCCRFVFRLKKYDYIPQKNNEIGCNRIENGC